MSKLNDIFSQYYHLIKEKINPHIYYLYYIKLNLTLNIFTSCRLIRNQYTGT